MKKTIATLSIIVILLVGVIIPNEKIESLKSYLANAATITGMTVTRQYNYVAGTAADPSQVNYNENALYTQANTLLTDINTLNTYKAELSSSGNTFTNVNTFSNTTSFTGSGAPTSTTECTASTHLCPYESVVRDTGDQTVTGTKTFSTSPVLSEECNATGDACGYESVVRDTGDQTIAGVKTFSSAPISSIAASGATELMRKGEVDTAISAVAAGGATGGAGAPVGSCTAGAIYYDHTTSTAPIQYYCRGADSMTWVKLDLDQIDSNITFAGMITANSSVTVSSSGSLSVTGANSFTGTHTVVGSGSFSSSGFTFPDPTAAQQPVTKAYFEANAPYVKQFVQTTAGAFTGTTQAAFHGAGVGSRTISAGALAAGSIIKFRAKGLLTSNSGSPAFTLTIDKGSIGNTFFTADVTNFSAAPTNAPFDFEGEAVIKTAGGGGTVQGAAKLTRVDLNNSTNSVYIHSIDTSFDTTAGNEFLLTLRATGGTNSATCTLFTIEVIK